MKRFKAIQLIIILNLTACVEQEIHQVDRVNEPLEIPCVFQNLQQAPAWICDNPVPGLYIQAIGMYEKSVAGQNYMQDMARIDALDQLAEKLKQKAANSVKHYLMTLGMGKTETINKLATSTYNSISRSTVSGTKNLKTLVGPDGRIYILVGLDRISTKALIENAVKTSIHNEQVLWHELNAKKLDDEVAAEIAAMEY